MNTSESAAGSAVASGLPLSGVTVLDVTLARAGPTCVRHLGDWGADVIRIEPPQSVEARNASKSSNADFQNLHRNKRVMQLNLKTPEGLAAFMRLAARADVVVENMKASVKDRLGISYADISKVNPRIVYGSISGFGQDGPYSKRGGVDQIVQAMGGLMSVTGAPGQGPMRVGIAINDLVAGTMLALGIMMALFDRNRTGVGRWVYTSLLETQVFLLDFQAARWLIDKEVAGQAGNDHPTGVPTSIYPTADGHISLAAPSPRVWARLCETLGKPEWLEKPEWNSRAGRRADRAALNATIAAVTREKPSAYWIDAFETAGVPSGPINAIDQVFADPQVQHLGIASPVQSPALGKLNLVASALNFSGAEKSIHSAAPEYDAHTDAILRSVGYSIEQIGAMRAKGII